MERELSDGLRAGAVGFSTSRSPSHATSDDHPVASRLASWDEVGALVNLVGEQSDAVFELARTAAESGERPRGHEPRTPSRLKDWRYQSGVPDHVRRVRDASRRLACMPLIARPRDGRWADVRPHPLPRRIGNQSFKTRLLRCPAEWKEVRTQPLDAATGLAPEPGRPEPPRVGTRHATATTETPRRRGPQTELDQFYIMRLALSANPRSGRGPPPGLDPVELVIDVALEGDFEDLLHPVAHPSSRRRA